VDLQDGVYPEPGYNGIIDSYIDSSNANTNYSVSGYIFVGYYNTASYRGFIRFDMSPLVPSNAVVVKAYLTLSLFSGSGNNITFAAYMPTKLWFQSAVTWMKWGPSFPWAAQGGDYNTSPVSNIVTTQLDSFVATLTLDNSLVESWMANPVTNYGLELISQDENTTDGYSEFYSSTATQADLRPKLTVYYTLP
jgi:hypothetical protein